MINSVGLRDTDYNLSVKKNKLNDSVRFMSDGKTLKNDSNYKSIGFREGAGLFFRGIVKQFDDTVNAIVKNPLKTAAVVGTTTLGLMSLPLVGVPSAVGGAALALGFGAFALGKAVYHTTQFVKNNESGSYDKARKNLEQIGGDSVDIALSAPFVPKALKEIKKFSKYGKIGLNTELINNIKSTKGIVKKFKAFLSGDKNLYRSMNYKEAVEKELSALEGITDAEKSQIKQYLHDYDVPKDKIPEVVLEQWSKEHGIKAKPKVKYATLGENTQAQAVANDCTITINDFKKKIPSKTSRYRRIKRELKNQEYIDTYLDLKTGEKFKESINEELMKKYVDLVDAESKLAPEAELISTVTHEREHIDQFARVLNVNPKFYRLDAGAKRLYESMNADIGPIKAGTSEYAKVQELIAQKPTRAFTTYLKDVFEIGAREAQEKLLQRRDFQTLNNVFTRLKNLIIPKTKVNIALNSVRAESSLT